VKDPLKVNDLVLIIEDGIPPLNWLLARVTELHPGKDGIARVATVKTAGSHFRRPVVKLAKLPIN